MSLCEVGKSMTTTQGPERLQVMPISFTVFFQANDVYWPEHCSDISKGLVANLLKISRSIVIGFFFFFFALSLCRSGKTNRHWSIWGWARVNYCLVMIHNTELHCLIEMLWSVFPNLNLLIYNDKTHP